MTGHNSDWFLFNGDSQSSTGTFGRPGHHSHVCTDTDRRQLASWSEDRTLACHRLRARVSGRIKLPLEKHQLCSLTIREILRPSLILMALM